MKIVVIAIAVALLVGLWIYRVDAGYWLYNTANRLEARLNGFSKHTIDIEGIRHTYYSNEQKDKPLLLLLHGFSAHKAVWLKTAKHLKEDYWVVIPDLAGHGETGFEQQWHYSAEAQAQRMSGLVAALGAEQAHVAGNSMGGLIAAVMAINFPQQVQSLIVVDPAGVKSPQPSDMLRMLQGGTNPFFIDTQAEFERFFAMTMHKPPFVPDAVKQALGRTYIARKPQLQKIFKDYNRQGLDISLQLSSVDSPALVIWGANDRLIHVSSAAIWQTHLDANLVVWDDLGHMPMLEAPERTAEAMHKFLSAH